MRTKQSEEREVQERTWIYLLHDQAPPTHTRNVTPAVLAARSAGVLGDGAIAPTLPSMSVATVSPAHHRHHNSSGAVGPYIRQQQPPSHHLPQHQQHASPYAPAYHGSYDAYGRPLAHNGAAVGYSYNPYTNAPSGGAEYASKQATAPRTMSSVVTASDKWQSPYQQSHAPPPQQHMAYQAPVHYQPQQFRTQPSRGLEFPPLRAMLSKSDKLPFAPAASAVPGPIVVKAEPQQQSMMLTKPAKKKSPIAASLLPKKRRHDELDEVFVAPSALDELDDDDDDDETKASKRNCFPKKCDFPMCKNSSRSRGFCYSHGGGRRCRMDGCNNGAVSRDLCKRHGGGRRCRISGCKSSSESGGLCYSHGGGRRCSLSWCSARAKKGGLCAVHIGNEHAEPPTESDEGVAAGDAATVVEPAVESKAAPTVAETLLSLAHVQSSPSSSTNGDVSPTSPSLPELSTPRFSSIASLLN